MLKVSDSQDQKPVNHHSKDLDKFVCLNFETITGDTYQAVTQMIVSTEYLPVVVKVLFNHENVLTVFTSFFHLWKNISSPDTF
jgi:hypothetical protein